MGCQICAPIQIRRSTGVVCGRQPKSKYWTRRRRASARLLVKSACIWRTTLTPTVKALFQIPQPRSDSKKNLGIASLLISSCSNGFIHGCAKLRACFFLGLCLFTDHEESPTLSTPARQRVYRCNKVLSSSFKVIWSSPPPELVQKEQFDDVAPEVPRPASSDDPTGHFCSTPL